MFVIFHIDFINFAKCNLLSHFLEDTERERKEITLWNVTYIYFCWFAYSYAWHKEAAETVAASMLFFYYGTIKRIHKEDILSNKIKWIKSLNQANNFNISFLIEKSQKVNKYMEKQDQ